MNEWIEKNWYIILLFFIIGCLFIIFAPHYMDTPQQTLDDLNIRMANESIPPLFIATIPILSNNTTIKIPSSRIINITNESGMLVIVAEGDIFNMRGQ